MVGTNISRDHGELAAMIVGRLRLLQDVAQPPDVALFFADDVVDHQKAVRATIWSRTSDHNVLILACSFCQFQRE